MHGKTFATRLFVALRRFLLLVFPMILFCCSVCIACGQGIFLPDSTCRSDSSVVYVYNTLGITALPVKHGFEYVFTPRDVPAVSDIAHTMNFRFVINASFFEGERLNAQHAGWFKVRGTRYAPIMKDRQLTHVVVFDPEANTIAFIPWQKFHSGPGRTTIEFQTGPLVVDSNRVAQKLIDGSINGSGKYTRTLLALTNSSELWFITVRKPVSLGELGEYLLSLSIFHNKRLDVVNLDGGPSVAFYAQPFPKLNFNTDDHLPLLLGVR